MSFLSTLTSINKGVQAGVGLATTFLPYINLIPGFGPDSVGGKAVTSVILVETIITEAGTGTVKAELVAALMTAAFPKLDPVKLRKLVDAIVTALNALADAAPEPVVSFPVTVKT